MKLPPLPKRPLALAEMEARLAAIRTERHEVDAEIREIVDAHWRRQNHEDGDLDEAAEKIASGEPETAPRRIVPERLATLRSRLELLHAADRKVSGRIAEQRERHNNQIARALRPAHRACAARIYKALTELVRANEAEEELRGAVPGIPMRPASFPSVGHFGPRSEPAQVWKDYAIREGLIDVDGDQADWPAVVL